MRTLSLIVSVTLLAIAVPKAVSGVKFADAIHLKKQTLLLELVQHLHQNNVMRNLWKEARKFRFDHNYDRYNNTDDVKFFVKLHESNNALRDNEIFNIFNENHRQQCAALYRVLCGAKTWDTFYETIRWARFYVQKDMFLNAVMLSVVHRRDCVGLTLPAMYEITPQYFFNSQTIQRAKEEKMLEFGGVKKIQNIATVTISTNYTSAYMDSNLEHKLAYLREDIGWNAMYYNWQTEYPFWMPGPDFNLTKDRRGELYLFQMRQLLSRYNLERLSNDLDEIPELNFYKPIAYGYNPLLTYVNGIVFPEREDQHVCYVTENYASIELLNSIEMRFRNAIDTASFKSEEYLGQAIAGKPNAADNSYFGNVDRLIRQIVESTVNNRNVVPSSLSHYATSLRDPVFYSVLKRLMKIKWHYHDALPYYTQRDVEFPGIRIEAIDCDKLVTYFDEFDADISNAVDVDYDYHQKSDLQKFGRISRFGGHDFVIKSRQQRLNHLPFTLSMIVEADYDATGVVRIYLGPKSNANGNMITNAENRKYWHLLDSFRFDFVGGRNVLARDSRHMTNYVKDRTIYFEQYRTLMKVTKGHMPLKLNMSEANGMPNRLMLPKGTKGGWPAHMFVIISPFVAPQTEHGFDAEIPIGIGSGARYVDAMPFDFPFDRKADASAWDAPNLKFKDVSIFHKV